MRVLDGVANRHEQFQTLPRRELMFVAVTSDGNAFDQFHHEVWAAVGRHAAIVHLGDVGMIHERQRLPLGFKSSQHALGIHARFDQLDRNDASHWLRLLCHPDGSHPDFADNLEQFESISEDGANVQVDVRGLGFKAVCRRGIAAEAGVCGEKSVDSSTHWRVGGARFVQIGSPLIGRRETRGVQEDRFFGCMGHICVLGGESRLECQCEIVGRNLT
jgi:hypothetical protein